MLTIQKARELRFADGLLCPKCRSDAVRWGKERDGTQRYRCKGCLKTFNDHSGTPVARTRLKAAWRPFSRAMRLGLSAAESATMAGISDATAYAWRHRVLSHLDALELDQLDGVVEADETYLRRSYKGQRVKGRRRRKRGGQGSKRGLGRDKVPILVACDRRGDSHFTRVDIANTATLTEVLADTVAKTATLVTDGGSALAGAARKLRIHHVALNTSRGVRKRGIYHTNTVNAAHNELKAFLSTFRGVSTSLLPRYLNWFRHRKYIGASLPVLPPMTGRCPTCGR